MSRSVFARLGLIGPLSVAAALGVASVPAMADTAMAPMATDCSAIHFDLANPSPGSMIEPGGLVLQGIATDSRAQGSSGIDRVDFFLDSRDLGGMNIGSAVPSVLPVSLGPANFQATVSIPNLTGGHDLFAYAHSTLTGAERVIAVPVAVGEDPSLVGGLGSSATEACTSGSGGSTATPSTTAPSAPAPVPVTPASPATTTAPVAPTSSLSSITLDVENPASGDTVHVGGYVIDGMAVDKAAQNGSGIDRIEIFLDNRDAGGTILTEATPGSANMWHAIVPLPANQTGLHALFVYAHSAATGQEAVVNVPVTLAP
jgi:hypothetical protein